MHAHTMGTAFIGHLDEVTGSLTPGKLADARVVRTFIDGETVRSA